MLYEVSYEWNGQSGKMQVRASSEEEAIRLFRERWSEYGDEAPPASACWISGVWSSD